MKTLKYWLWKFSFMPFEKCPYCESEVLLCGYDEDKYFRCSKKECEFNKNGNV
jgi:hypothetical protein